MEKINEILNNLDEKTKIEFTVVWLNQIQNLTETIKIMWENEDGNGKDER